MEYTRYNPNFYTSLATDRARIQAAIDAAAEMGEEAVIPAVNARTGKRLWEIDGGILLPDGIIVKLVNAHLRLADGVVCHMFQNKNAGTPAAKTLAGRQHDITVRGIGKSVLDGGEYNGIVEKCNGKPGVPYAWENIMIYMHNVENLRIEGIHIMDQRQYGICMMYCSRVIIRDITFHSHCNVPNQDGIDIHAGCNEVMVQNIRGCTGDDVVAITTIDWGCMAHEHTLVEGLSPDIHDVTVRDLQVFAANGCALVRILNHDGHKIYNIRIDNLQEVSPWSDADASVAPNPDLYGIITEDYHFKMERKQTLGEFGYRSDSAIRIGENSWYGHHPAEPGDTWGISISNVSTHARHAVTIANTLWDSSFENIRLHGNGFRAVFFNNGDVRNVTFRNVTWTENSRPHPEDKEIHIEWNATDSVGLSAFHFSGTNAKNLHFEHIRTGMGIESVFAGHGDVELTAEYVQAMDENTLLLAGDTEKPLRDESYVIAL